MQNLAGRDKYRLNTFYIILLGCSYSPHECAQECGGTTLLILTFALHERSSGSGHGCLLYIRRALS